MVEDHALSKPGRRSRQPWGGRRDRPLPPIPRHAGRCRPTATLKSFRPCFVLVRWRPQVKEQHMEMTLGALVSRLLFLGAALALQLARPVMARLTGDCRLATDPHRLLARELRLDDF